MPMTPMPRCMLANQKPRPKKAENTTDYARHPEVERDGEFAVFCFAASGAAELAFESAPRGRDFCRGSKVRRLDASLTGSLAVGAVDLPMVLNR
ncbi:hypothetical protein MCOR02_010486 [Pyricularia oryzae]|nr:hypothetical protein MCOR02_010486 [Pyricularia oryzae]